jgi:glycosyltransferase involved in cell wall biosynthesis
MPLVSVIIPAYNARRWLPETLASVRAQREDVDLEVIIVDDGSTDDTAEYVTQEWPDFRLIRSENRGVSHARNLGTANAKGEWLQYLDADDLLLPGKLSRHLALIQMHPECDAVYANWQKLIEDQTGHFVSGEVVKRSIQDISEDTEVAFFSTLWCPTGCYLWRRSFLEKVLPWKEWLPVIQDARFAWDAAAAGARWVHDPEIAVLYRQHRAGSVSTKSRLAFLTDCYANVEDVRHLWCSGESLSEARKRILVDGYESVVRGLYEVDKRLSMEAYQRLISLKPDFKPSRRGMRLISGCLGYEKTEYLALQWRRLKGYCLGS